MPGESPPLQVSAENGDISTQMVLNYLEKPFIIHMINEGCRKGSPVKGLFREFAVFLRVLWERGGGTMGRNT